MCQVIAEIGWNHMGDMALAEKMIVEAANAGADFAKFQSWSVKNLKPGPWDTDGRRQIYEKAELSEQMHKDLMRICGDNDIQFLTSVFCKEDAEKVANLGCKKVKIPSPEIANIPLIQFANEYFDEVFISCGAANYEEIETALNILGLPRLDITIPDNEDEEPFSEENYVNTTLLHCVSSYPCPFDKVNLPRITRLKEKFGAPKVGFGYSGHGEGIYDALASLEYRVEVIEKHFTTDKNLPGRDNKFAILPHELKYLCDYIQHRWQMTLGHSDPYAACEEEVRNVYRGRWQS